VKECIRKLKERRENTVCWVVVSLVDDDVRYLDNLKKILVAGGLHL
jgi:hypothetical protein